MNIIPVQFDNYDIRRVYDEKTESWYFSVVDIIRSLMQQQDFQSARNYWKVLKNRLSKEGNEPVTRFNQLNLPQPATKNNKTKTQKALDFSRAFDLLAGGSRYYW